jgi:hypothetical protein
LNTGKPRQNLSQYSRGCSIDGSRESGDKIRTAHPKGRIFKTKTGKVVDGSDIASAATIIPAQASSDIDFFLERPGLNLHGKQKGDNPASMLLVQRGKC